MASDREGRPADARGVAGGSVSNDEIPRWVWVSGGTVLVAGLLTLIRYAIDVAGLVLLVTLVVGALRVISEWTTDGDSASGWALGSVGMSIAGIVLIGFWLFGASRDPRLLARNDVTAALSDAVNWAEAHGWGQRALLPGGRLDRSGAGSASAGSSSPSARPGGPGGARRGGSPETAGTRQAQKPGPARSPAASESDEAARLALSDRRGLARSPVGSIATQTIIELAPATVRAGAPARVTAIVTATSGAAGVPDGIVVFRRGDLVLGQAELAGERNRAVASLVVADLPVGRHQISAEFVAGGPWRGSWSPAAPLAVVR